jgi:hypothetical protein
MPLLLRDFMSNLLVSLYPTNEQQQQQQQQRRFVDTKDGQDQTE